MLPATFAVIGFSEARRTWRSSVAAGAPLGCRDSICDSSVAGRDFSAEAEKARLIITVGMREGGNPATKTQDHGWFRDRRIEVAWGVTPLASRCRLCAANSLFFIFFLFFDPRGGGVASPENYVYSATWKFDRVFTIRHAARSPRWNDLQRRWFEPLLKRCLVAGFCAQVLFFFILLFFQFSIFFSKKY